MQAHRIRVLGGNLRNYQGNLHVLTNETGSIVIPLLSIEVFLSSNTRPAGPIVSTELLLTCDMDGQISATHWTLDYRKAHHGRSLIEAMLITDGVMITPED